jgi:hypothetical protein
MRELSRCLGVAAMTLLLACAPHAQTPQGKTAAAVAVANNDDDAVLEDFQNRVKAYMKLHNELEDHGPRMKETKHPEEIIASQKSLSTKLKDARKTAKPGDIFTPQIRARFRQLMYPETTGTAGRETKQVMKEDAPAVVPLKVNSEYPQSQPLPTVPPNMLAALPKLPEELEYRVIDKHLILRDVHANIIVDYIPNAIR